MPTVLSNESLLGNPSASLGLRIRGTNRDGQVLWLHASKVTIGSDRSSTLRLKAPGVAPVHCLILRGQKQTIARCWSPDTRCNGAAFDETAIVAGDRLGIGPLEFEVIDAQPESIRRKEFEPFETSKNLPDSIPAVAVAADSDSLRNARRLVKRLQIGQRQARRRIRRLTVELRAARDRSANLESQLTQRQGDAAERESRREEWERQQKVLEAEREKWLQTQAHLEHLLSELGRREAEAAPAMMLAPVGNPSTPDHETVELRARFDSERQAWESQRAAQEAELSQRKVALNQESEQLSRLQTNLERQQATLEQQLDSLAQRQLQLETQSVEFAQRQQETGGQQQALQADIDKLDELRSQIALEREATSRERADIEQRRAQLDESSAQLQAKREELAAQELALDAERQTLAEQHQRLAEEQNILDASKQALQSQQEQIAESQQELSQAREQLLQARKEWEADVASPSPTQAAASVGRADTTATVDEDAAAIHPSQIGQPDESADAVQAESDEEAASSGPSRVDESDVEKTEDSDDVFARLRALDILKGNSEQRNDQIPETNISVETVDSQATLKDPPSSQEPQPTAAPSTSHEEESIDQYMTRLLQRVGSATPRNESANVVQPSTKQYAIVEPTTTKAGSAPSTGENHSPIGSLSDFEPRTAAPERSRDLAAMREIANLTSRDAIAKHHWRSSASRLIKKLMVSLASLACGIALILIAPTTQSREFYSGLVAIAISLYWMAPAVWKAMRSAPDNRRQCSLATMELESAKFAQRADSGSPSLSNREQKNPPDNDR
jgi:hypothetical protein